MKHGNGKKPTLKQKKELTKHKLNYENWLVVKDSPEDMHLINRSSGKPRIVYKKK